MLLGFFLCFSCINDSLYRPLGFPLYFGAVLLPDSCTKSARMGVLKIIYLLCNWNNIYCCPISEREEFGLHTTQPTAAKKTGKKGWTENHKGNGCLSTVALVAWPDRFRCRIFLPTDSVALAKCIIKFYEAQYSLVVCALTSLNPPRIPHCWTSLNTSQLILYVAIQSLIRLLCCCLPFTWV